MRLRLPLACLLVAALGAPAAAQGAWPPAEPLGTAGRWVVDADGRVVVARGLNLVDKRPPYLPGARGWRPEVARWLRRQGFTAVRLGWIHKGFEPQRGAYRDDYLERFAADVHVATDAGLLVLVDLHQDYFSEATGGEGFPDWMVLATGVPPRRDRVPFDLFWANAGGMQEAVAAAWRRVATRLRGERGLLGYDLLNEPYPGTLDQHCAQLRGCREWDTGVLDAFHRRVASAVRAADPARTVWAEPHVIFNQGVPSWISRPVAKGAPAGFSFHVYCSELPAWLGAPDCSARRPRAFEEAEAVARRTGSALLMTEFGATDRADALVPVAEEADRRSLGWLEWALWNHDPFAARPHEGLVRDLAAPPEGANVKEDKLALLARPYPRAVAGTPRGWTWSAPAREFVLRYGTEPADPGRGVAAGAETEVVLPPSAFPAGWRAEVRGGRVVGAADGAGALSPGATEADVLRVVAAPDAGEVEVHVVAGRPAAKKAKKPKARKPRARKPRAKGKRPAAKQRRPAPKRKAPARRGPRGTVPGR